MRAHYEPDRTHSFHFPPVAAFPGRCPLNPRMPPRHLAHHRGRDRFLEFVRASTALAVLAEDLAHLNTYPGYTSLPVMLTNCCQCQPVDPHFDRENAYHSKMLDALVPVFGDRSLVPDLVYAHCSEKSLLAVIKQEAVCTAARLPTDTSVEFVPWQPKQSGKCRNSDDENGAFDYFDRPVAIVASRFCGVTERSR